MVILPYEEGVGSKQQQYWAGFNQFCGCDRTGDYLTPGELAALTAPEMKGYSDAIRAADAAEYADWRALAGNRNAYGDLTEF